MRNGSLHVVGSCGEWQKLGDGHVAGAAALGAARFIQGYRGGDGQGRWNWGTLKQQAVQSDCLWPIVKGGGLWEFGRATCFVGVWFLEVLFVSPVGQREQVDRGRGWRGANCRVLWIRSGI